MLIQLLFIAVLLIILLLVPVILLIQIVDTKFGSNINYQPSVEKFVRLTKGTYNSMIIYLTDQNNNPLTLLDNNLLITLLFKKK
jgi:hypothetical protein